MTSDITNNCPLCTPPEGYKIPSPPSLPSGLMWHWPTREWLTVLQLNQMYKSGETCCDKYRKSK